jgi:hypothetical protein
MTENVINVRKKGWSRAMNISQKFSQDDGNIGKYPVIRFEEIVNICEANNYRYFIVGEYIEVITDSDQWKITRTKLNNGTFAYNLFHLNKRGKMHWHKQGKGNFNKYQIECRLKTHDTYCKSVRGW